MEKAKKKIRSILKRKHGDLSTILESVWVKAKAYQDAQTSKEGHTQGTPHCEAVERNLDWLIPDKKKAQMKPVELFALSAAACCHDVGKVVEKGGPCYSDDHGHRAFQMIMDDPEAFGLLPDLGPPVAWTLKHHNDCNLAAIPKRLVPTSWGDVSVVELAAIFALADMLHSGMDRVSSVVAEARLRTNGEAHPKTIARQHITGWAFNDSGEIQFYAIPETIHEAEIVRTAVEMMREPFSKLAPTLMQSGYPCFLVAPYIDDSRLGLRAQRTAAAEEVSGFVEMDHYDKGTCHLFVGRGSESGELVGRVMRHKVTLMTGESGVGKTSLILAGLFPAVEHLGWKTVYARPFDTPATSIKQQIEIQAGTKENIHHDKLVDLLYDMSDSFCDTKVLVALDQFEETLACTDQKERKEVEEALLHLASEARLPNVRVLVSFRGDAQYRLAPYLEKACGASPPTFYLQPLAREAAVEALMRGFESAGTEWDKRQDESGQTVVDEIASDLKAQTTTPDSGPSSGVYPPFLQMVGETLSSEVSRPGRIDRALFEKQGRSAGIIGRYLAKKLDDLREMRDSARKIVVELASAEGGRFRRSKAELQEATGLATEELEDLLERMVKARLIRPVPEATQYELIHDSLARLAIDKLLTPEELRAKELHALLSAKASAFEVTWAMLTRREALLLYMHRHHVRPTEQELQVILAGCLMGRTPGWFWLRGLRPARFAELVKPLVRCPDPGLRRAVVTAIARLGQKESLPFVVDCTKDRHWEVRRAALDALVQIAGRRALPVVRGCISDDAWLLRRSAVDSISQLGDRDSLPLVRACLLDENPVVRRAAVRALVHLADTDSLPLVRACLLDGDPGVRRAAGAALGRLDKKAALGIFRNRTGDEGPRAAAQDAAHPGSTDSTVFLERARLRDQDPSRRLTAVRAIAQSADLGAAPLLRERLADDDWRVREAAIAALVQLADKESLAMMRQRVRDDRWAVRRAALAGLAQLDDRDCLPVIREWLSHGDPAARRVAVGAAVLLADKGSIALIRTCCADTDPSVCCAAIAATAELGDTESLPVIRPALLHPSPAVRRAAIEACAQLGDSEALPLIRASFTHCDPNVRHAAIAAVGALGDDQALDELADPAWHHGKVGESVNLALMRLDRRLYCPEPLADA
jgi:HEAT repeat protein